MNKTQEKALRTTIEHITGECGCAPSSKSCIYWKQVDKGGDKWQTDLIMKEIKLVLKTMGDTKCKSKTKSKSKSSGKTS